MFEAEEKRKVESLQTLMFLEGGKVILKRENMPLTTDVALKKAFNSRNPNEWLKKPFELTHNYPESVKLVNTGEYLAPKEKQISVKRRVKTGFTFIVWTQTRLK